MKITILDMQNIARDRGGRCLSKEYINNYSKLTWQCKEDHHWDATPANIKQGRWCPVCGGTQTGTIEEMQEIATRRGGRCLSGEYINSLAKLAWQCKEGHQWQARPSSIKQGRWCPVCGGAQKSTIEEMRKIAEGRGGDCLSEEYINSHFKLEWQCKEGHKWKAVPHNIKQGGWCPVCGGAQKSTIEEMQKIAEGRGGHCLSEEYINNYSRLTWQCKEGHQWEAVAHHIKRGGWCPTCDNMRNGTIEEMQEIAKQRGGKCLSKEYINNKTKLSWQCSKGHRWVTTPGIVRQGHWCPACAGRWLIVTIDDMHEIAKSRGGQCLSLKYTNSHTKLTWQCKEGHQWQARPASIKSGQWCRVCAGTQTGTIKEMQEIAAGRGGKCLSVEYVNSLMELAWRCKEGHQWQARPSSIKQGHWCPACAAHAQIGTIEEMQEIAKERGGRCLSREYINTRSKLVWECKEGHQWEAAPNNIKEGSWCAACAGKRKGTIEEMQEIAKTRGGLCLSKEYINNRSKLTWQCGDGHQWEAVPNNIKKGSWCFVCQSNAQKDSIEAMQRIAKERGGLCLSKEYINCQTELTWQCEEGHQWESPPRLIKQGHWCLVCRQRSKIEEMQEIARNRGGLCLSKEYINTETKLKFQCKDGHQWEAAPHNIKRRRWCPRCAGKNR